MKLASLVAAVAAALIFTATSMPAPAKWSHMTLAGKRTFLVQNIHRDRTTVRWWITRHRILRSKPGSLTKALSLVPAPIPKRICPSIGIRAPTSVCSRAARMRHSLDVLTAVQAKIDAGAFPPHHDLWMCIHGHEGNWDDPDSGGNGHYGGLQMHPGWGYGTSFYANKDSQLVQEQSAERGYTASGHSTAWLMGQWNHPDCLRFA